MAAVLQNAPAALGNTKRLIEELWSSSVRKEMEIACAITWKRASPPKPRKDRSLPRKARAEMDMKRCLPLVIALVLSPPSKSEPLGPADIVFVNGNVYTVNDAQPQAEAIAIKGERIVFVGSNAEANKYSRPATRTIDLKGKTVVPGFTDSHYHIFGVGHRAAQPRFDETTSRGAVLARVKEEAEEGGPGEWMTGRGWIETFWKPAGFLNREELDKVAPANPVFLERVDGHGAVANSKALQLGGIDLKTPDPFGGKIIHDKKPANPPACSSTTRWIESRRKSRRRPRRKKGASFCSECNARSPSAGARFKIPAAISLNSRSC